MGMVFTKEELLSSSVSGTNSSNPSLNQVSQTSLDENKKNFVSKMFSVYISTDLLNIKLHNIRLKKFNQYMCNKIQNVRKIKKKSR
jgi:hypothetical protein